MQTKDGPDNLFVSIQKPNVDVHFTGVAKITENGIIGDDGTLRECDTIICATGFGMLYRPWKDIQLVDDILDC